MDLEDYRRLSDEADKLGLFRFVITGVKRFWIKI